MDDTEEMVTTHVAVQISMRGEHGDLHTVADQWAPGRCPGETFCGKATGRGWAVVHDGRAATCERCLRSATLEPTGRLGESLRLRDEAVESAVRAIGADPAAPVADSDKAVAAARLGIGEALVAQSLSRTRRRLGGPAYGKAQAVVPTTTRYHYVSSSQSQTFLGLKAIIAGDGIDLTRHVLRSRVEEIATRLNVRPATVTSYLSDIRYLDGIVCPVGGVQRPGKKKLVKPAITRPAWEPARARIDHRQMPTVGADDLFREVIRVARTWARRARAFDEEEMESIAFEAVADAMSQGIWDQASVLAAVNAALKREYSRQYGWSYQHISMEHRIGGEEGLRLGDTLAAPSGL